MGRKLFNCSKVQIKVFTENNFVKFAEKIYHLYENQYKRNTKSNNIKI